MNNWKLNDWGTKCSLVHIHSRKKKLKSTCPVGEYISVLTFLDFNIVIRGGMLTKHAWIFNSYFRSTRCLAILAVWKVLEQLKNFLAPPIRPIFFLLWFVLIALYLLHREWLVWFKQLRSVGIKMQRQGWQHSVSQSESLSSSHFQIVDLNILLSWQQ